MVLGNVITAIALELLMQCVVHLAFIGYTRTHEGVNRENGHAVTRAYTSVNLVVVVCLVCPSVGCKTSLTATLQL
jgi:hypothetical protein